MLLFVIEIKGELWLRIGFVISDCRLCDLDIKLSNLNLSIILVSLLQCLIQIDGQFTHCGFWNGKRGFMLRINPKHRPITALCKLFHPLFLNPQCLCTRQLGLGLQYITGDTRSRLNQRLLHPRLLHNVIF